MDKPKVVAIVGQTASGKTSLSIKTAKRFNGEVVSCDSRQVYQGLDIGSGKVTAAEMDGVPHHLLDVCDPADTYTASDFKADATRAIDDIVSRNKLPIIAGGTFFYLDQLRYSTLPEVPPNNSLRAALEQESTEALFVRLQNADPDRARTIDRQNRHRLVRALEICDALGHVPALTPKDSPYHWLIIGIRIEQSELDKRIHTRLLERIENGMIEEVESLLETVPADRLKSLGLEYRYVTEYLEGTMEKDELIATLQSKIRQFSRRQLTWLKRDQEIQWYRLEEEAKIIVAIESFLNR